MNPDHPHADDIGAWLLGALDAWSASAFGTQMRACDHCRGEVARLQFVADNLPLAAPVASPPAALRARIMHTVEAEAELLRAAGPDADRAGAGSRARSGRLRGWFDGVRPWPAAALACSLLLFGLVAGAVISGDGGGDSAPLARTIAPDVTVAGASARLEIGGGTARLAVSRMPAPPEGRVYQVWLKRDGEAAKPTHTLFNVRRDGRATVTIDEPLGDADELLVTAERGSGSIIPTRQPVLRATL